MKRAKKLDTYETATFRIPKTLKAIVDLEAKHRGITRTSVFIQAIEHYILRSEDIRAELEGRLDALRSR